jgi:hypothetical protein
LKEGGVDGGRVDWQEKLRPVGAEWKEELMGRRTGGVQRLEE